MGRQALHPKKEIDVTGLPEEAMTSADLAGRIFADLERTGQPIGRIDPLIAAIALQHGLTLVTGNRVHYQRIHTLNFKLRLDNWRSSVEGHAMVTSAIRSPF